MKKSEIVKFLKDLKKSHKFDIFERIGIFGSYSSGRADIFSDIDIAVKVDKKYLNSHDVWDYFDAMNDIKESLWKRFKVKIDIFDLDSVSPYKKSILKDITYV